MKKGGPGEASREFKLVHQILCITSVDFLRRTIYGFVELHIIPLCASLSRLRINCKQCRVYRVCVKGPGLETWLEAGFQVDDPGTNVCQDGRKRSLDHFCVSLQHVVISTETDNSGGELTIRLPSETVPLVTDGKTLRISIEFILDRPRGGVQFVVPNEPGTPNEHGTPTEKRAHMFSVKHGNSSRLWFPCVDSFNEVCTWKIEVTVDKDMVAICPGDLQEKVFTPDEKKITYHYSCHVPASASMIGLAIGPFETFVDPNMPEVTHFCLPELMPLLKHSVSFLNEAFDFFEEHLNTRYPYNSYKQVFVDESYDAAQVFASMSIFNTNLLHSKKIIDQTLVTRTVLTQALAEQFFGCFVVMHSWADFWLPIGISGYLSGLFTRKMFGNNSYRERIYKELEELCKYELEGQGLPPLFPFPLAADPRHGAGEFVSKDLQPHASFATILQHHPHLVSPRQLAMMKTKARLVVRMIDVRIGPELLLQALNKVLTLATTASAPQSPHNTWNNLLLTTTGFLKTISSVSGKDINNIMDQWVCHSGVTKFYGNFSFNRKRNIVELDITQDLGKGCLKYVGPLIVSIQELDGSFTHTVQVEDTVTHHELPCHSKSRRNKKKKIPLVTGEEVDMDLSQTIDSDSPVLWVRIDPDMTWARKVVLEQPDYMWQYQLRYERDVTSQLEAIKKLEKYPSAASRTALTEVINQQECFYLVRMSAAETLCKIGSIEAEIWDGDAAMIAIFQKAFGSQSCPNIPKFNDFSNLMVYFIQKTLPIAISKYRNHQAACPRQITEFILDLLKYNDNRYNQFSDGNYKSSLIDALANTITPAFATVSTDNDGHPIIPTQEEAQLVLAEIVKYLNLEKLLSTYKYAVTCSCLKAIRTLQVNGHIPAESAIFRTYVEYGQFEEVRRAAIDCLIDLTRVESSEKDLEWLLDIVERDPVPSVRHYIIEKLSSVPPFTRKSDSSLNTLSLVERLWQLINCDTSCDHRLRCHLIDLYNSLYGSVTPSCVPSQGFGVVIDLRGRTATSNMSPMPPMSPEISGSVSAGEDNCSSKRSTKRKYSSSRASSPQPDYLDVHPGTPMSVASTLSGGSKIRLKIKLGGNDISGAESGSESQPPSLNTGDTLGTPNLTDEQLARKIKKKKKKKHRHKDKKEKERDHSGLDKGRTYSTDGGSRAQSPLSEMPHS